MGYSCTKDASDMLGLLTVDAVNLKQLRARYHARLIEVAKVSFKFALECTERASIEQMKIYLGEK